eukprot:6673532-Pyramimonas_sp.AAC.1
MPTRRSRVPPSERLALGCVQAPAVLLCFGGGLGRFGLVMTTRRSRVPPSERLALGGSQAPAVLLCFGGGLGRFGLVCKNTCMGTRIDEEEEEEDNDVM